MTNPLDSTSDSSPATVHTSPSAPHSEAVSHSEAMPHSDAPSHSAAPSGGPRLQFNDGHSIPQLGFGVYKASDDEAEEAVGHAFHTGYRHIDTATLYYNEAGVGRAIAASGLPRSDVFVTTKVWNDDQGFENTIRACETSLSKLGLDYLDLYLIHWPMPMNGLFVDTWKALIDLRERGMVRSIGVSNFPSARIDELVAATDVTPVINQVELHPYFAQRELRADNAARGVLSEAWAPLARGGDLFREPTVAEIAQRLDATPAQVVLAWHGALGTVAIPKSVTPSRIEENWDSLSVDLSDADLDAIAGLDRGPKGRTGFDPETMKRRPR